MPVNTAITIRKGTGSQWSSTNPVLASGEPGYDLSNNILKIGDGVSNWNSLSNHKHSSVDITNFNSSVSGLLPVKNIVAGSGVDITSSSGVYSINFSGSSSVDGGEYPLITINSQPSDISVGEYSNATFSVSATTSNPSASISYQWQTGSNNINWNNITSATSSTLSLISVAPNQNNRYYRCNLQSLLSNINSNAVQLVVVPMTPTPTITTTITTTPTPSSTPILLSSHVYAIINLLYMSKIENTIYNLNYDA